MDGATIVSFRHNEKPLGAAFSIEGWTGDKLRPVVSLGSQGQVGKCVQCLSSFAEVDKNGGRCKGDINVVLLLTLLLTQAVSIQPSSGTSFAKEAGPREGLEGDWEGEDLKV